MDINMADLQILVAKQTELDNFIERDLTIDAAVLTKKRQIAFIVEFGEFLNEVRDFKFWSKKAPAALDVQTEEYIDGLHFLLSLGLHNDFDFTTFKYKMTRYQSFDDLCLALNGYFHNYTLQASAENFAKTLACFFDIASALNYKWSKIMEIYEMKNKINHERQKNNY